MGHTPLLRHDVAPTIAPSNTDTKDEDHMMTTKTRDLAGTVAELNRLTDACSTWQAEQVTSQTAADSFEREAAARLVDEPQAAEQLAEEQVRRQVAVSMAARTLAAAQAQLADAGRAVLLARAEDLRGQASSLIGEADTRTERTRRLLDELAKHEGCTYAPRLDLRGSGVAEVPKSDRLRHQARALDKQAADLETSTQTMTAEQVIAKARQIAAQSGSAAVRQAA